MATGRSSSKGRRLTIELSLVFFAIGLTKIIQLNGSHEPAKLIRELSFLDITGEAVIGSYGILSGLFFVSDDQERVALFPRILIAALFAIAALILDPFLQGTVQEIAKAFGSAPEVQREVAVAGVMVADVIALFAVGAAVLANKR